MMSAKRTGDINIMGCLRRIFGRDVEGGDVCGVPGANLSEEGGEGGGADEDGNVEIPIEDGVGHEIFAGVSSAVRKAVESVFDVEVGV